MRKHMGWHDVRTNNAGVINAILAGECTQLQGMTTEGVGVILECVFSIGFAIAIGFYFSWPMAVICLCLTPLTIIGSAVSTKSDQGVQRDEKKEESDLLASDAIANFKTVASFACDDQIIAKYKELNEKPFQEEQKKLNRFAAGYGIGQLMTNVLFGALYYASARLVYHHPKLQGEKLWLSLFSMMFGAFATGQASAFGPDANKAKTAAEKIFKITEAPSEIDALAEQP